jgi:hypothetical protein
MAAHDFRGLSLLVAYFLFNMIAVWAIRKWVRSLEARADSESLSAVEPSEGTPLAQGEMRGRSWISGPAGPGHFRAS